MQNGSERMDSLATNPLSVKKTGRLSNFVAPAFLHFLCQHLRQ
jgi:hypothetical protein